ncbi:MAG: tetratricopeptide repeat protein [Bacteroidetes bacterium]|nr:tetratricopeptide repeat protein [Bacteroidota bacterium]
MKHLFSLFVIVLLAACGGSKKSEADLVSDFNSRLEEFDRDWNSGKLESLKGQSDTLLQLAEEVMKEYPQSKDLPLILFKSGETASKMKEGEKAIEYFAKLVELFPTNEDAAYAMYLIGLQYENVLGNADKAVEAYRKVRKNYPQSVWASNAKSSIMFLMDKEKFFNDIEADLKKTEDSLKSAMK